MQRRLFLGLLLLLVSLLTGCGEEATLPSAADPTMGSPTPTATSTPPATATLTPMADPTLTATLAPLVMPTFTPVPTLSNEAEVNAGGLIAGDLAFLSLQGEEVWLYTVAVDGSSLTKVSEVTSWDQPQWSPDGKALAFLGKEIEDMSSLYVIRESDPAPVRVTRGMDVGSYTWSPEGDRIAFSAAAGEEEDIYLLSLDTFALVNMTASQGIVEYGPVWSPTGTQIAFRSSSEASNRLACWKGCRYRIYVTEVNGPAGNRQIWVNPGNLSADVECDPTWSPDGRYLAFLQGCETVGNWTPYLFDSQDGSTSQLVTDWRFPVWEVGWISDDELSLLHLYTQDDRLYAINRSGENLSLLFPDANLDSLAGSWTGDHRFYTWHDRISYEIFIGDMTTNQSLPTGIKGCDPVWAPSGDWLAFTTICFDESSQQDVLAMRRNGSRVILSVGSVGDIEVMHRDGSDLLNLTLDVPGGSFQPFWKP